MSGRMKNKESFVTVLLIVLITLLIAAGVFLLVALRGDSDRSSSSSAEAEPIKKSGLYTYEVVNNSIRITEYFGEEKHVVVPETIEGKPVEIIAEYAFDQHGEMVSVTLPECLTVLEGGAFYHCYGLSEVTIPKNIRTIGANPFFRCSILTAITVDPENKFFMDEDGVLFNKSRTEIVVYPEGRKQEQYAIPDSVEEIRSRAFSHFCKDLRYLVISPNLVDFPDDHFLAFPDDITFIVEAGSAAEQYAKEYKLKYEIVQSVG